MSKIILASKSPRRSELLRNLGLDFTVATPDVDERSISAPNPVMLVVNLARAKASAAEKIASRDDFVIAADTMVWLDGKLLGKPRDESDACAMLRFLSGRAHTVGTGVAVLHGEKLVSEAVLTRVFFKELSDDEIREYVESGEPLDKAGAYGIQGLGALFVEKIEGDYPNVVGLPVFALNRLLRNEFGTDLFGLGK